MPDVLTIADLARQVRSKNAGPFWLTIDVFLDSEADYEQAVREPALTPQAVAQLYNVPAEHVNIFRMPDLRVIKFSFPRPVPAGSFEDRDLHGGQQHVPLSRAVICSSVPPWHQSK